MGTLFIRRIGAANWLTIIIVCWGGVTVGMGFSPTWQILAVCRALLGICEVRPFFSSLLIPGRIFPRLCLSHQLLV